MDDDEAVALADDVDEGIDVALPDALRLAVIAADVDGTPVADALALGEGEGVGNALADAVEVAVAVALAEEVCDGFGLLVAAADAEAVGDGSACGASARPLYSVFVAAVAIMVGTQGAGHDETLM